MRPLFEHLSHADDSITLAINGAHCEFTDTMWRLCSDRLVWAPLYVAVVAFLIWRLGWRKGLLAIVGLVLTIALCDQIANMLKYSVARLRPCHNVRLLDDGLRVLEGKGSLYGFFSAHSANAMGFAVCSHHLLKLSAVKLLTPPVYGLIMYTWALMVSISRVFVGKHFFGDVIVGVAVGVLTGWAVYRLIRFAILRIR